MPKPNAMHTYGFIQRNDTYFDLQRTLNATASVSVCHHPHIMDNPVLKLQLLATVILCNSSAFTVMIEII